MTEKPDHETPAAPFVSSGLLGGESTLAHGFFTRRGGVSSGGFASLNCSLGLEDELAHVLENRARVATALGCEQVVFLRQVHGTRTVVVDEAFRPGDPGEGDALVTRLPGVALGVLGADCAPILFAEPGSGVIGAAHGGWKGVAAGIPGEVVARMEALGADRSRIIAAIGPAIQQASYAVGPEFREQVQAGPGGGWEDCFSGGGNGAGLRFDLPRCIHNQLRTAGIGAVERFDTDTYRDENHYFSYRRSCHRGERQVGCQAAAIALKPTG